MADHERRSSRGGRGGRSGKGGPSAGRRGGSGASPVASKVPAPARRVSSKASPKPALPDDEEPELPKGVLREIERAIGRGARAREVSLALSIGAAAIDEQRPDLAVEYLAWAKDQTPRIAAIREAYGVALYHAERYSEALAELKAYRRMAGKTDQNHVAADCLRALGRDIDQVATLADELMSDEDAPDDRRTEAAIVWAAAVADAGEVADARAILRRFLARVDLDASEPAARVHYLAGDLAARDGDRSVARKEFETVVGIDAQYLDAARRLAELDT